MAAIDKLSWSDAIEKILEDCGGSASLERMYAEVGKYRDLSNNNEYKATLRGILYRDINQRKRIVRVGLGVFGLRDHEVQGTYQQIVQNKKVAVGSRHSSTQGMLLELGNFYGFNTYTPDRTVEFDGKRLGSIASLAEVPHFSFADLVAQVKKVDVVWFAKNTARPFPKFALEVENTPQFKNSMLKLYQLREFQTDFYLIADAKKQSLFEEHLSNDPFHEVRQRFQFFSFDNVAKLYSAAVEHEQMKEQFFRT